MQRSGTTVKWAPRSQDLNSLNFFMLGYLNDRLYKNPPEIPYEMRQSILAKAMRISGYTVGNYKRSAGEAIISYLIRNIYSGCFML